MPKATAQALRISLSSLFTVLILLLSLFNLNKIFTPAKPQVLGVKVDLAAEKKYWQDLTAQNPTYRDGYVELAKIECELKEIAACQSDLEKARALDPNFVGYPSLGELSGAPSSAGF